MAYSTIYFIKVNLTIKKMIVVIYNFEFFCCKLFIVKTFNVGMFNPNQSMQADLIHTYDQSNRVKSGLYTFIYWLLKQYIIMKAIKSAKYVSITKLLGLWGSFLFKIQNWLYFRFLILRPNISWNNCNRLFWIYLKDNVQLDNRPGHIHR